MSLSVTHFPWLSVTQKGCWSPSGRLGSDRACEHHDRSKGFVHLFLAVSGKKNGKLWIFTLDREIGMREAKFSSVVISLFVTAQRRTFMPEGARHGHFSDYTAFLNTKWCMKMLYPDNRLYFNVKCVLGAHFYSVALFFFFFARNSFVKLLRLPVVLLYLLFWNNFCHTLRMTAVGWQRWDVGYLHF